MAKTEPEAVDTTMESEAKEGFPRRLFGQAIAWEILGGR
jgi:hypothetical protein